MGGMVGATLALHRPDLFDGLVLICPGLFIADKARARDGFRVLPFSAAF